MRQLVYIIFNCQFCWVYFFGFLGFVYVTSKGECLPSNIMILRRYTEPFILSAYTQKRTVIIEQRKLRMCLGWII